MKKGIDFFPLDVSLNLKFELIEAKFGLTGFGVMVKLFQRIYRDEGYFCPWDDEAAALFASKVGVSAIRCEEIVEEALRLGLLDRPLYEQEGVLSSRGIQRRYFSITSRRKSVEAKEKYLLLNPDETPQNLVLADKTVKCRHDVDRKRGHVCRNRKNVDNFAQSKGKESKAEQSSCCDGTGSPQKTDEAERAEQEREILSPIGGLGENVVLLSDRQMEDLLETLSLEELNYYLKKLARFIIDKDAAVKNHYATILRWAREDRRLQEDTQENQDSGRKRSSRSKGGAF